LAKRASSAHHNIDDVCLAAIEAGATSVIEGNTSMIHGTSGDDIIIGSDDANNIISGTGNDVVCGRGATITLMAALATTS
jgi:Ca2+-binding RTX toxin-like protein